MKILLNSFGMECSGFNRFLRFRLPWSRCSVKVILKSLILLCFGFLKFNSLFVHDDDILLRFDWLRGYDRDILILKILKSSSTMMKVFSKNLAECWEILILKIMTSSSVMVNMFGNNFEAWNTQNDRLILANLID